MNMEALESDAAPHHGCCWVPRLCYLLNSGNRTRVRMQQGGFWLPHQLVTGPTGPPSLSGLCNFDQTREQD